MFRRISFYSGARLFGAVMLFVLLHSAAASHFLLSTQGQALQTAVAQETAAAQESSSSTERQRGSAPRPEIATPYSPQANIITDGGFEAGIPNPYWNEASTNYGTPICDPGCGSGGGTGPHSGSFWVWFGGVSDVVETGSVEQTVIIPPGTAVLSFWLEIPAVNTTGFMSVSIDGNVLFTVTEADAPAYSTYTLVALNVSAYANGGAHTVRFFSTTNAGAGPLNFFVDDVRLDAAGALYNNGLFINSLGSGAGDANESVLQNVSLGMGTYGFGAQASANNRVADDFTVTGTGWQLDSVYLYTYQTGSTTTSPITAVNLRIWNGPPGISGASVVFGDTTTNRLLSSTWVQAYRVSETSSGDTSRPIMTVAADLGGVTLPAGTYWLDWQLDGSASYSGPWAPPLTMTGQKITGNARQYLGSSSSWNSAVEDSGSGTPSQGFPFILVGEAVTPAHDLFTSARAITSLPYQHVDNTVNATLSGNDPTFPCGSGNQGHRSVWYRFTPSTTMDVVAYTYTSKYDTMLAVWTGSAGALTNVACNDDAASPDWTLQSEVGFRATSGTTYYIEVAAYGSAGAGGELTFNLRPADKWSFSGPQRPSPSINELTIVTQNPNTVFAATTEGVFKSTDGGANWSPKRNGLSTFGGLEVTNLVVDPANPQNVYISTWGDGVYRSTDGGENWSQVADPLALRQVEMLPAGVEQVRVGGAALFPAHAPQNITVDKQSLASATNKEMADDLFTEPLISGDPLAPAAPDPIDWTPSRTLAIHPTNGNRLIVGVADWGFYITQNASAATVTWSPLTMPGATLPSGRAVSFAPSNPNIAYASFGDWGENGGIFRSNDGGLTWNMVAGNGDVTSVVTRLAIDPTNPNRVLAATYGQGVMVTTNGGDSWSPGNNGLTEMWLYNLEISPVNANIVYAGADFWIWQSSDGGASWGIADTAYPDFYNWALALHPTNSNIAYAGSRQLLLEFGYYGGGIYKTTNGGGTFTPQRNGLADTYVLDIVVDPNDPNMLYAATWASGIFRSADGGVTWQQANAGLWLPFVYTLEATQGPLGTVLYAGTFYSNQAMFVSHNQGIGWTELPDSLPTFSAFNVFDITSSDGGSNNLVVATGDGLHVTYDGGQTWAPGLLGGVSTENIILSVARVHGMAGRMVAGTYGDGIYYSNNDGYDWSAASGESSPYIFGLSAAPGSSTEVYAAHAGVSAGGQAIQGISRSANGGAGWNLVTRGLPTGVSFRSVDHNPESGGHVYGGSIGRGMWVLPAGSANWFPFSANFTPTRVRTVQANVVNPMRVFASTDGQGAWLFSPDEQPFFTETFLPVIRR